jgi:hypothetical protein
MYSADGPAASGGWLARTYAKTTREENGRCTCASGVAIEFIRFFQPRRR